MKKVDFEPRAGMLTRPTWHEAKAEARRVRPRPKCVRPKPRPGTLEI